MKKLLLFAFLIPVAGWAQNNKVLQPPKSVDQPVLIKNNGIINDENKTVRVSQGSSSQTSLNKRATGTVIGTTFYDLQTNRSIPRRVILYPDGKLSVVWTGSNRIDVPGYPDRGTAYNHFNGTSWGGQNAKSFESDRAGWPSIVNINENGTPREMIVSHFAPSSAAVSSGGLHVMKNGGIGSYNFFEKIYRKPGGPLWPRMVTSGDYVHIIASYTTKEDRSDDTVFRSGVRRPTVYFRYRVSDSTFVTFDKALPGYDSTRYALGSSDAYSMDARDNHVAIVMGGTYNDVALWKSEDYGATWNKTIINPIAIAPYDPIKDEAYDTTLTNDGSVHVTLDKNGTAHVFYPRMNILNVTSGDDQSSYFPTSNGIFYWNDVDKQLSLIAGMPDLDGDGEIPIAQGTRETKAPSVSVGAAGYGTALSTFPSAAVDDSNYIYMVFSAPNELDYTLDEQNYRDIFVVMSKDGGKNWSNMLMLTEDVGKENVFASVARDANDKLHMVWMQDDEPGTVLTNEDVQSSTPNEIRYAAIPLTDIKNGAIITKIHEHNNANELVIGNSYPNPVSETMFIPVTMNKAANVNVKVTNVLGQQVHSQNYGVISTGNSTLSLDVKNLSKGVYFYNVTAGITSVTHKIVVE